MEYDHSINLGDLLSLEACVLMSGYVNKIVAIILYFWLYFVTAIYSAFQLIVHVLLS